jgi:hypothetical protein
VFQLKLKENFLMISNISDFYNHNKNDKTILSFIGEIESAHIEEVMQNLEDNLEKLGENVKIKKKLYNTLIEALQNLYHHADDINLSDNDQSPNAICVVDHYADHYKILTGNYIKNDKIKLFKVKLERINELTKEELKKYYLEVLNNGEKSLKDGAGLGMIEISRKTDDKLDFDFVTLNNNYSLFILKIKISK